MLTVLAAHGATQTSLLAQPGTVAFLVVFGMAVILFFVFRSMSKHLRKVQQLARDEADVAARAEGQGSSSGSSDISRRVKE